ncbi:MAG TPA: hypothetical protein VGK67_34275 [Myxococcales bacterium]
MRTLPLPLLAAAAALWLAPVTASAENETLPTLRDVTSIRAMGKAGASIGYGADTDAIHANPAAIAATQTFNLMLGGIIGIPSRHYVLTVEGVDSKINEDVTIPLSGGVSYQYYVSGEGLEGRKGHVLSVSLAVPMYSKYAFVGITGRYLKMGGNVVSNAITMDAGLFFRPFELMGIGLAGYNLIDVRSPEARRGWGAGISFGSEKQFHVDVDARVDEDKTATYKPTFSVGGEYLIAGLVAPRIGYSEDMLRGAHLICAGVSVIYEGWAFEAAYRQAIVGKEITFAIGMRMVEF